MRHLGLAPVTLLTVALTVFLLPAAGWFSQRDSARSSSRFCEPRFHARAHDLAGDAAGRCRHGQPTHWRYLLLHR